MRSKQETCFYRQIAIRLGVSEFGLDLLFRLKRGDNVTGGNAAPPLARKGLISGYDLDHWCWREPPKLTEAGVALCAQARALGY